ncbi:uncharacterized protein LOC113944994 isoform X2 [Corapipo altera]|uniref:uncharacterized protein LOC113944994 isoform X2 n=1 Tax=Corapipo altera TaxID=415028 RepID=UPI000FD62806|nr:uncharacterized protein LOC113944994 isoform X2 [Corapipo altera]
MGRRDPEAVSKRRNRSLSERDKTLGKSLWAPRRPRPPPPSRSAGSLLPVGARPVSGKAPALKEPIRGYQRFSVEYCSWLRQAPQGLSLLCPPLRGHPAGAGAKVGPAAGSRRRRGCPGPPARLWSSYQPNISQKGHLLNEQRAEASLISPGSPISSVSPSPPPAYPRSAPEGNLLWFGWFSSLRKG